MLGFRKGDFGRFKNFDEWMEAMFPDFTTVQINKLQERINMGLGAPLVYKIKGLLPPQPQPEIIIPLKIVHNPIELMDVE